ncbi:MAG: hypothetical protein JXQ67_06110 [Campylobacterales bacterium]|nr:hypothetical protein [Campylobacterales bacterium]
MNIPFLHSFFKKKNTPLHVPDSILVKKLKSLCKHSDLRVYSNIKIYHHKIAYTVPLIMLDPLRGLYIFEIRPWTYDDLKNADIQKATNQESSLKTLSYDKTHQIIRQKFNELRHNDGVPIFNYLIMENLSTDEYQHLNDSFQTLLPVDKLIFNDSQDSDIFKKLQEVVPENHTLPGTDTILGTLFVQYTILQGDNIHIATQEQIDFINTPLNSFNYLYGLPVSGKSSILLLKALTSLLENPSLSITIIKPTTLACDIFKKRLLDLIEYGIIEVDITAIEIITPLELLNKHLKKLNKLPAQNVASVDLSKMYKKFTLSQIVMCDDVQLLPLEFIEYLRKTQQDTTLLLVQSTNSQSEALLTKSFINEEREIHFLQTNPYAKALHLAHTLLVNNPLESIMIVSNIQTLHNLQDEELKSFLNTEAQEISSENHLLEQTFSQLTLTTYTDINTLSAKHIIMLDLCSTNLHTAIYTLNLAEKSVHVLYEDESQEIIDLKEMYESSKERRGVEEPTLS